MIWNTANEHCSIVSSEHVPHGHYFGLFACKYLECLCFCQQNYLDMTCATINICCNHATKMTESIDNYICTNFSQTSCLVMQIESSYNRHLFERFDVADPVLHWARSRALLRSATAFRNRIPTCWKSPKRGGSSCNPRSALIPAQRNWPEECPIFWHRLGALKLQISTWLRTIKRIWLQTEKKKN